MKKKYYYLTFCLVTDLIVIGYMFGKVGHVRINHDVTTLGDAVLFALGVLGTFGTGFLSGRDVYINKD